MEEIKKSEPSVLEQAEKTAQRIEEANKKAEELAQKLEQLQAKQILSGRSFAGKIEEKIDPEQERADRIDAAFGLKKK